MSIKGFSIGGVTQKYDYNALDNIPNGEGLSEEAKQAILQIAQKVAYIDDQGQTYYDALHDAFYPPKTVVLLTAAFNQGSTVIYDDTALNDLKEYLTVTAKYDDNTTTILPDNAYSLSGLLEAPSSTVTVLYNGVSTTFSVSVTARATLSSITATYTQSGTVYDTDTLDSLKDDLVVTAVYSDSSTATVAAADYTLSGTLSEGTSTITVSYGGKTTTFDVIVTEYIPIPSGYTRFDYIACDGNAYCEPIADPSNPPVPLGYSVRTIAQQTTHSTAGSAVACGGANADYYIGFAVYSSTAGRAGAYYGSTYNAFADIQNLLTAPTEFITKFTTSGMATTTINSGVSNTVNVPVASVVPSAVGWFRIGYAGATSSRFIGKIYRVEISNTSDTLTHQFIPCKRNSDNKAGMYDTVSNTFFVSTGSSAFTAGND